MGAILAGLRCRDGYLFATDAPGGDSSATASIVKINATCGAFIGAPELSRSRAVKEILVGPAVADILGGHEGLSSELAGDLAACLDGCFREDAHYRNQPLPFLLLLVGYRSRGGRKLSHILMRNRVIDIKVCADGKEYVTKAEWEAPVRAENLHYGSSELVEYLSGQLPSQTLTMDQAMLLAYGCISESQIVDPTVLRGVAMAKLSSVEGFMWVDEQSLATVRTMSDTFMLRMQSEMSRVCTATVQR